MVPTKEWMASNFAIFNKRYFNNKLKTPEFIVGCESGYWGQFGAIFDFNIFTRKTYNIKKTAIFLTNVYDRREKDILSTLLHEMIHAYILTIDKVKPIKEHDKRFYDWANKLNIDGWNIIPKHNISKHDVYIG